MRQAGRSGQRGKPAGQAGGAGQRGRPVGQASGASRRGKPAGQAGGLPYSFGAAYTSDRWPENASLLLKMSLPWRAG